MEQERWVPAAAPPAALRIGALRLDRWTDADAPALLAAVEASRAHLADFMPWSAGYDASSATTFLAATAVAWAQRREFNYRLSGDGLSGVLGSVGLMARRGPGVLEIGYWVRADAVRRGLATRASALLTAAAFALPGVETVEIHHDPRNTGSEGIPARLGFRRLDALVPGPPGREEESMVCWVAGRADRPAVEG